MKRPLVAAFLTLFVTAPALGDEAAAKAVVDKAVKAAGGEDALAKAKVLRWKSKATITFNGGEGEVTGEFTAQGLDRFRSEFEADFGGNMIKGATVVDGDKGWRKIGEDTTEFDAEALSREKQTMYLQLVPVLLLPLKGKSFKVDSAADEKVGEKPAAVVKATGPDGRDFTLWFDKETGLPVKMAAKVFGFQGEEYAQETTYSAYKDFGGIKKATKIKSKRDGEPFIDGEITDFKVLDKADAATFAEPK